MRHLLRCLSLTDHSEDGAVTCCDGQPALQMRPSSVSWRSLTHSAWLTGKRCLCKAASRHWTQEHVRRSVRWCSALLPVVDLSWYTTHVGSQRFLASDPEATQVLCDVGLLAAWHLHLIALVSLAHRWPLGAALCSF